MEQAVPSVARRRHELPPGLPGGKVRHVYLWVRRPIFFMEESRRRFGSPFTLQLPRFDPIAMFSEPEIVREIFTAPADDVFAGQANALLEPLVGSNSLLLLDGARHLRERRLLTPSFHGERMRAYGELMRDMAIASISTWTEGVPFPLQPHTQEITLQVILRAVFGSDIAPQLARLRELITDVLASAASPILLLPYLQFDLGPWSLWGRLRRKADEGDAIVFDQIRRRRDASGSRIDLLSMLVDARDEDGSSMTDQEIRDEVMTFVVAGHETTATALTWVCSRLFEHPEVYARLQTELNTVMGSGPDIDVDRIGELKWLDATIRETLRLNPVVPLVARRLQRDQRFGAWDLPAGSIVAPSIYLTHRRPDVFADPEHFRPERFLDTKVSPYHFFPFGGGVRRCIGEAFALYEMRVVVATLLKRFRIRQAPGYRMRLVRRSVTFAPSEGLPIVVKKLH